MTITPVLLVSLYMAMDEELSKVLGLAFDCGAVTTGPVTVPLVLSLGIGIAHAAGKGGDSLSGFGIVTLASLFPIVAVMLLTMYVSSQFTPEMIIAAAQQTQVVSEVLPWYEVTPGVEIVGGIRAIVPLVIFLLLVMMVLLREKLPHPMIIFFGIFHCVLGMVVFNLGLSYGLSKLGGQSGGLVPAAFTQIEAVEDSPLYFVAFGISIGVAKIIFDIPIAYLLIPGYILAIFLTSISNEEFVRVAPRL